MLARLEGYKPQARDVVVKGDQEVRLDFAFASANQAPVASGQSVSLDEDADLAITVAGSDPDGDALAYHVLRWPQHGTLSGRLPAATYTPDRDYHGTDRFEFVVSDGVTQSGRATVAIRVDPVNDAPVAVADRFDGKPDTVLRIPRADLLANDIDIDGDTPALESVTSRSAAASVAIDGNDVVFRPPPGWDLETEWAFFDYTITDGHSGHSTASVSIRVSGGAAPPRCSAHAFSARKDVPLQAAVACTDADGGALSYALSTPPARGVLQLAAGGTFTYTPPEGYVGTTTFRFTASDGALVSEVATATITVAAGGTAPVCRDVSVSTLEDVPVRVDPDCTDADGDALTYTLAAAGHGTVEPVAGGGYRYRPDPDYHGEDSFIYRAADAQAGSAPATMTVRVAPANDRPIAAGAVVRLDEDAPATTIDLGAHVTDAETGTPSSCTRSSARRRVARSPGQARRSSTTRTPTPTASTRSPTACAIAETRTAAARARRAHPCSRARSRRSRWRSRRATTPRLATTSHRTRTTRRRSSSGCRAATSTATRSASASPRRRRREPRRCSARTRCATRPTPPRVESMSSATTRPTVRRPQPRRR